MKQLTHRLPGGRSMGSGEGRSGCEQQSCCSWWRMLNGKNLKGGVVSLCLFLSACASGYQPKLSLSDNTGQDSSTLLYSSRQFKIVTARPGDDFSSLAERYLGSADYGHRIERLNPPLSAGGGDLVAVPTQVMNQSSVYSQGFRTIPILCYHQFTDKPVARHRLDLARHQFRNQLQYLKDNGFQVLRLSELEAYLQGKEEIPPKSVVLTIDDGYRSVYKVAFPLLKEFGYPATVFVYTDFLGGSAALSWSQMKEMHASGLIDIQSHSKSHASFVAMADESVTDNQEDFNAWATEEIRVPRKLLREQLGHPVDLFSYPYGDSSNQMVELLAKEKVKLAVTVQKGGNPAFADPLRLRRTMIFSDDDLPRFKKKLQVFVDTKL
ncbi:polysaccharide deacetylase family protein [Motiliproteus sp. MSK22-1]|uniref:polysaccharide deacetylase family protein n=1 Tax=Motiliproteus sp. MSK22-1 TaxID=1897630 RepID=UPI001180FC5B|nr:polysaccharide deacetylase family protein [Motiliproteus sp. MSK22-1]